MPYLKLKSIITQFLRIRSLAVVSVSVLLKISKGCNQAVGGLWGPTRRKPTSKMTRLAESISL